MATVHAARPKPTLHPTALCATCGVPCTRDHHVTRAGTVDAITDAHHDPRPEAKQ